MPALVPGRGWLALLLAALLAPQAARAEDEFVPASKRAVLLLRALLYDRSLPRRLGREARVVVLYKEGVPESQSDRDQMLAALAEVAKTSTVSGLPLAPEPVAWSDDPARQAELTQAPIAALFVCRGLKPQLPLVVALARRARTLTASGERQLVEDGVTLGVVMNAGRARLVINRTAARQEGVEFEAGLLSLAELIDR